MSDNKSIALHTQEELEGIRQRVGTTMVDMVDRTVQSLDRMSRRLDEIDAAMEKICDPATMTRNELMAYTAYMRDSFRLKQDFLRTLAGYDVDISRVPAQAAVETVYDEMQAEELRNEVIRRDAQR